MKKVIFSLIFFILYFTIPVFAYDPIERDLQIVTGMFPDMNPDPEICLRIFRSANFSVLESKKTRNEVSGILFVGDSRTVGMSYIGGYDYIGKNGAGYNWFSSEAVYSMLDYMNWCPDNDVVLCFGVNDVWTIDSYISYYRDLFSTYPQTRFWIMSVNPCQDDMAASCGYMINNDMINQFNEIMQMTFPEHYLDINTFLWFQGFGTNDGVHYDEGTYLVIQEYTRSLITEKINY